MRCPKCGLQQLPTSRCKACGADLGARSKRPPLKEPPSRASTQISRTWLGAAIVGLLIIGGFWLGFKSGTRHVSAPPVTPPVPTTSVAPAAPTAIAPTATAVPVPAPAPPPAPTTPPTPSVPITSAPPAPTEDPLARARNEASEAIQALQDLQSATRVGLTYNEYSRRLVDTRIKVDRYLRGPSNRSADIQSKIEDAMDLFEYARTVWAVDIKWKMNPLDTLDDAVRLSKHSTLRKCRRAVEFVASLPDDQKAAGMVSITSTVWGCASRVIASI